MQFWAASQVFVLLLKEKVNRYKVLGMCCVIVGIILNSIDR